MLKFIFITVYPKTAFKQVPIVTVSAIKTISLIDPSLRSSFSLFHLFRLFKGIFFSKPLEVEDVEKIYNDNFLDKINHGHPQKTGGLL